MVVATRTFGDTEETLWTPLKLDAIQIAYMPLSADYLDSMVVSAIREFHTGWSKDTCGDTRPYY